MTWFVGLKVSFRGNEFTCNTLKKKGEPTNFGVVDFEKNKKVVVVV